MFSGIAMPLSRLKNGQFFHQGLLVHQTVGMFFEWKAAKFKFFSELDVMCSKFSFKLKVVLVTDTGVSDQQKLIVYFSL